MRDGERTREHIIERAAALFNEQGYSGASISDIMAATGLQKGGIYRHFGSKEELAVEAFDFAVGRMAARFGEAMEGVESPLARLKAIAGVYARIPVDPPVPGGCPVMNTAIESDSSNPRLRARARDAMDGLRRLIRRLVAEAMAGGELRADTDPDGVATVMISTLEGGVMLSMLYDDPAHAARAAEHLGRWLEALGPR